MLSRLSTKCYFFESGHLKVLLNFYDTSSSRFKTPQKLFWCRHKSKNSLVEEKTEFRFLLLQLYAFKNSIFLNIFTNLRRRYQMYLCVQCRFLPSDRQYKKHEYIPNFKWCLFSTSFELEKISPCEALVSMAYYYVFNQNYNFDEFNRCINNLIHYINYSNHCVIDATKKFDTSTGFTRCICRCDVVSNSS